MKRLIVDEVQSFRAEVRAQARASGAIRKTDRSVESVLEPDASGPAANAFSMYSLPIPSREDIINSPITDAPHNGATSGFTAPASHRPPSPVMDDPSAELERELAGASLGA